MKKRIIPLVLALGLLLSVCASAAGDQAFRQGNFSGLAAGENGGFLVTDVFNKIVWKTDGRQSAESYAGKIPVADLSGEPEGVYLDGPAESALFVEPWAISPFLNGYAVSDADAHVVRYVENGTVHTLAGVGTAGSRSGSDRTSEFNRPTGLATADDGTLYVADSGSGTIRTIGVTGKVSDYLTGLVTPTGLCWHDGALYIAETGRNRICKAKDGKLEVVAGSGEPAEDAGEYYGGFADGSVEDALFDHPQGVAVGLDGAIYVADSNNAAIRVIWDGRVETLAVGGEDSSLPLMPRTPLVVNGVLRVADLYGGGILTLPVGYRNGFRDVPAGAWYFDEVYRTVNRGIMNGIGGDAFAPDQTTNRAMVVAMLWRLAGEPDAPRSGFEDVEQGSWYEAAVNWAADAGVVRGASETAFVPDATITREQLATILYRYAQTRDLGFTGAWAFPLDFPDADTVSAYAYEPLCWMTMQGVINGIGDDGTLSPAAGATRAQTAAVFLRFAQKLAEQRAAD